MTMRFREIKADVLDRIARGEWALGNTLPNEADLADAYNCARATVNRALRELAEDGILERKRKAGTRVRATPLRPARFDIPLIRGEIEAEGGVYGYALIDSAEKPAPRWLARRLNLTADAPVLHLECLHSSDGIAFQFEDRWISLSALPKARKADFQRTGPNEWLLATLPFTDADVEFDAIGADEALAGRLGCQPGTPLFRLSRATWFEGQAITFVRLCYRPGYRMTSRL